MDRSRSRNKKVVKFSLASFSLKKKDFSVKIEKKIYYSKSSVKFRSVVIRVPLILRRRGGKMSVCKRQKLLRRKIQLIFKSVEEKKIPDVLRSARWNNETQKMAVGSVKSPMAMLLETPAQSEAVRWIDWNGISLRMHSRMPVRKFLFSYSNVFIFVIFVESTTF